MYNRKSLAAYLKKMTFMRFSLIPLIISGLVLYPAAATVWTESPALGPRIEYLLHQALTSPAKKGDAAIASETRKILAEQGLPTIAQAGDKGAYAFVVLVSYEHSLSFQERLLQKVKDAVARGELPPDAGAFYLAHLRIEKAQRRVSRQKPAYPDLKIAIDQLAKKDQAVRQQNGFDLRKMKEIDLRNAASLQAIFNKYGVPTYKMVGVQASTEFLLMAQHQPPKFRRQILPKLKVSVYAGEIDPAVYALIYDRSLRDSGKKQLYGSQLDCGSEGNMHVAPIEDAAHVNARRAELGLIRLELYEQLAAKDLKYFCDAVK